MTNTVEAPEAPPRLDPLEEQALVLADRLSLIMQHADFSRVTWRFVREYLRQMVVVIDDTLAASEDQPDEAQVPLTGTIPIPRVQEPSEAASEPDDETEPEPAENDPAIAI